MSRYTYIGSELELFAEASHWKSYLRAQIAPYLGAHVLEVGAGIGGTTRMLCQGQHDRWVCVEPDPALARQIEQAQHRGELPGCCQLHQGTLQDLAAPDEFASVLYIDVLEHIEDDTGELQRAARRLRPGGNLVVLAPAHPWLFSPFDVAVGHFRRYTRASLRSVGPPQLTLRRLVYLDSAGLLASLANRLLLRASQPTPQQIRLWDRWMVPMSRRLDPWIGHRLGKSVLAVWQRPSRPQLRIAA